MNEIPLTDWLDDRNLDDAVQRYQAGLSIEAGLARLVELAAEWQALEAALRKMRGQVQEFRW